MRVFCRALLGLLLLVFYSAGASAAPILIGAPTVSCAFVPVATNCAAVNVDDPAAATTVTGSFGSDSDVAMIRLLFSEDILFSAATTSYETTGFDGTLGLFDVTGRMLTIGDFPAVSVDLSAEDYDAGFDAISLTAGTYYLALIMWNNEFSGGGGGLTDSLLSGFGLDDPQFASACLSGCDFTLDLTATPVDGGPAPVPEPGTLGLLALGSACAGLARRRRAARRDA